MHRSGTHGVNSKFHMNYKKKFKMTDMSILGIPDHKYEILDESLMKCTFANIANNNSNIIKIHGIFIDIHC